MISFGLGVGVGTPRRRPKEDEGGDIRRSDVDRNQKNHQELFDLGLSRRKAFERSGAVKDIEESIEFFARAIALTPNGHAGLPGRHDHLAWAYGERYLLLRQVDDIEKSIKHRSQALALTLDGHEELSNRHTNLAWACGERFKQLGQVADIEKAIEHRSRGLVLTPNGHTDLLIRHDGLAWAYGERYLLLRQVNDIENSIKHRSQALALTSDGHEGLPDRHTNLAWAFGERYLLLRQVDDIEDSIKHRYQALALTPEGHEELSNRHACLAWAYGERYLLLHQVGDLEDSIKHRYQALVSTPEGHADLPDRHANLGGACCERYQRLGQVEDLDKAIQHWSQALALTPNGHADLPDWYANLAWAYSQRYRLLGLVEDRNKAIEHATSVSPEKGAEYASQLQLVDDEATSLAHIERVIGGLPDNERDESMVKALLPMADIPFLLEALRSTLFSQRPSSPSSTQSLPSGVPVLGLETGLEESRFSEVDPSVVMNHARSIERDLEGLRPPEAPIFEPGPGNTLTIIQRAYLLDARVSNMENRTSDNPDLDYPDIKVKIHEILDDMVELLSRLDTRVPSLKAAKHALDLSLSMLAKLARWLFSFPKCDNSAKYFRLSKLCLILANEFLPRGHPVTPIMASHWGTLYLQLFQLYGEERYAELAVKYHASSLNSLADNHPRRAMFIGWLGRSHLALFEHSRNPQDLKRGMELNSEAWAYIQSKSTNTRDEKEKHFLEEEKKQILEGKSRALQCLVGHVGGLNDTELIDAGVVEWKTTLLSLLRHPEAGDSIKAKAARTLGFLYITRFDQLSGRDPIDLEKSLTYLSTALAMFPKQDQSESDLLSTLCIIGHSLVVKPPDDERMSSELPLKFLDLAKKLMCKGDGFEPHLYASFGDMHMSLSRKKCFDASKRSSHLDSAFQSYTSALPLCSPGSRLWAKVRQNQGICRVYAYQDLKKEKPLAAAAELKQAICQFIAISLAPRCHLLDRFTAACSWATHAASHPSFRTQALYGYETAIELMPLLACFGAGPGQRQKAAQQAGQLATEGAALAIQEEVPMLALPFLEQGRSVKWGQLVQLQTPLRSLKSGQDTGHLAARLEKLLKRLQIGENGKSAPPDESTGQSSHDDLDLQNEYETLLEEIRKKPGFGNFMRPRAAEDLLKAAGDGPVVIINVDKSRSDALIVRPSGFEPRVVSVPLPELSPQRVIDMRSAVDKSLADIGHTSNTDPKANDRGGQHETSLALLHMELKKLWDWVVYPVLAKLKYTPRWSRTARLPLVTWCPTGALSFLPLHAAGDYSSLKHKVFEYVISSYTPTLGALLPDGSYSVKPKSYCDILLVNPDLDPDEAGLPAAKEELDHISRHFERATLTFTSSVATKLQRAVRWPTGQEGSQNFQGADSHKLALDLEGVSDVEPNSDDESNMRQSRRKHPRNPGKPKDVDPPRLTQLIGPDATPNAVYDQMQKHDWVHFACHTIQDRQNPADSGFELKDGVLSLRSISEMPYKQRGLAFLSACQTAQADQRAPDEAVHMATGMLMAGYTSVIATMWRVRDVDASAVANLVYDRLLNEGKMDCRNSASELHFALDELREYLGIAYWIPFIHYGPKQLSV